MREPKDIEVNGKTLDVILEEHRLNKDVKSWIDTYDLSGADLSNAKLNDSKLRYIDLSGANLSGADLSDARLNGANLSGADLSNAKLIYANLICADLSGANLSNAKLNGANLCYTDLYGVDLSGADLSSAKLNGAKLNGANLYGAELYGADLSGARLNGADLNGVDLYGANLRNVKLNNAKGPLIEYRKGKMLTENIIGYKQCKNGIIVTLEIPRGAIVYSINGNKCRTNKAKVIAIDNADRAFSQYKYMSYYVGDEFTVYNFNCEYNLECAEGIHFFMTREEAENFK